MMIAALRGGGPAAPVAGMPRSSPGAGWNSRAADRVPSHRRAQLRFLAAGPRDRVIRPHQPLIPVRGQPHLGTLMTLL